jgi:phospholipase/carboxylesterase
MNPELSLHALNIPPANGESPTHVMVLLHGWGANCQDLAGLIPYLNLPSFQFLCPDAPFSHPQVPGGKAWYALERSNFVGIQESRQLLTDWLNSLETKTGIPLEKTFLAGFSQGGAMTLDVGLGFPLAGLISLSGFLHSAPQPPTETVSPVLIVHGAYDPVVPLEGRFDADVPLWAAQNATDKLTALGVPVEYHELKMGHEITLPAINLVRSFVMEIMSKQPSNA